MGVLLYGSSKKFNINDFENLSLILPLDIPEGKSIQQIENYTNDLQLLEAEVGKFDQNDQKVVLHEAFWQCQTLFNEIKGKVATKKIMLFTTDDNPHANEKNLLNMARKKGNDLKDTEIVLEVIPFNVSFDFSKFYNHIV